ncbi:hypothetical protein AB0J72_57365 [Dactylosporangium sp. NPDC049742]|uniref:hypothetical protein n=1 Tax=Dactylosporangium sp. NPDC049742 TaxID=3154737 RepID=UPI003412B573
MIGGQVGPISVAATCYRLVRKIADGDRAALAGLYRLMVHEILAHVRPGLDGVAAVRVTRAVFVEVWLLAPVSQRWHADARAWLFAIADRRAGEQARAASPRMAPVAVYDQHLSSELNDLLRQPDGCRPAAAGPQ